MVCKNCNNPLAEGVKFCTSCGTAVEETVVPAQAVTTESSVAPVTETAPVQSAPVVQPVATPTPVAPTPSLVQAGQKINIVELLLGSILNPISNVKNNDSKLKVFANSAFLLGVVAGITTVLNIIVVLLSALLTPQQCFMGFCTEVSFTDRMKAINWNAQTWQLLLGLVILALLIAGVYYIVSLLFKKESSFPKLLGIVALGFVPALIVSVGVAPLLGSLWAPLNPILNIVSILYSLSIIFFLYKDEFKFEKEDNFMMFNLISSAAIILIIYLILMQALTSAIGSIPGLI